MKEKCKSKSEFSALIRREYDNMPKFSRPTELLEAIGRAKSELGLYPVYTKNKRADKFVRFVTDEELADFKAFPKPKWKPHGSRRYGLKMFTMEIADTYAGGFFPDRTPYWVMGLWRKKGLFTSKDMKVQYEVSMFIDGGHHIDTQRVYANRPMPLKKVLAEAVRMSNEIKGKCFDGYWY